MAVRTRPGDTLLTRMPYLAHSMASVCAMFRTPALEAPYGADDYAVDRAGLLDNLVDGGRYARLVGDVCRNRKQTAGELLGRRGEVFPGFRKVNGVDLGGIVEEAAFCDAEADAAVRARD
ncbi:hypothetical protein Ct61P_10107 [Colletotrichum tofieldiae]|nr:hypothetical protein Ct61P_10107 [Colletotrichum tofieldiae]